MTAPSLLTRLLSYIEEVERLNKTPAFKVPTDVLAIAGSEVAGLPGVLTDLEQDGPVWLSVPRLHEESVPPLPERLSRYVTLSANPGVAPVFKLDTERELAAELLPVEVAELQASFEQYQSLHWQPWSETEQPRRKTIALYKALFALHQQLTGDAAAPLELVWGIGMASWAHASGKDVQHPLLTQGCFIELDNETFALSVRPREVEPQVELTCYVELEVPGVRGLEAFWAERRRLGAQLNPFQTDTFEDVLRSAVGYLDPEGALVPAGTDVVPGDHLVVTPTWAVFARKRSADVFVADVQRFQEKVGEGSEVPAVIEAFVSEAADTTPEVPHVDFRGLSNSAATPGVQELFFPLPYNAEQVDILRKLEHSPGVVVQGPPGTGKTHTIANIISHYLAQGKRVLVTSKGDTALSVLQDKLPAGIRDLSVALLANERAGLKQFEHSIQQIASRVTAIRPDELAANIEQLESRLAQTHAKIAKVDADIAGFSQRNAETHVLADKEYTAEDLAKLAVLADTQYAWLDDPVSAKQAMPFTEVEAEALRVARRTAGRYLCHAGDTLPALADLPRWAELSRHRAQLARDRDLADRIAHGAVPALAVPASETQLRDLLDTAQTAVAGLAALPDGLLARISALPADVSLVPQLRRMSQEVAYLERRRLDLLGVAVSVPDDAERHPEFVAAVSRLAEGKSAFSLPAGLFGKKDIKQHLAQCLVIGQPPKSKTDWQAVQNTLQWRESVTAALHHWNALCGELNLPCVELTLSTGFRQLTQYLASVERAIHFLHQEQPVLRQQARALFGSGELAGSTIPELSLLVETLHLHVERSQLATQFQRVASVQAALDGASGLLPERLRHFLQVRLGAVSEPDSELAAAWLELVTLAERLTALGPALSLVARMATVLVEQGLPRWASRLRQVEVSDLGDPVLPDDWCDAWHSKVADAMLVELDGHDTLRGLFRERQELTEQLARTYREVVAERAWLGVYRNSTDKTKQALQSFLTSIQAMGSGNGLRAVRHRRAARDAMEKAYLSVPCWVLPQWRISETLPAEMGLFDLVIIDEASQSDISSLPAILRGKKLLVVGDHKQVSPAAVGVSEAKITAAYDRLLKDQPHGAHMTSDKSIYDLARVVFAGQSVMLKEHFRCVPEIIEYSNREFYNGEIRALRIPREDERFDQPLVDVYVQGGYRNGDKNLPEAKAIVDEIEALVNDPWLSGKTIGVVTLVGNEQARLISEMIATRIAPEDIIDRDIVVGQPPAFQGRERDIIMLSMVQAPGDRSLSSALPQQQRLNVAMSRARDRLYLFRSVPDGHFPADSLSGRLMAHFREPYRNVPAQTANLRDRCESGFERELFDELQTRGYRLQPQVRSGGYRIDLVVEGADGKRLAIECDGDRFHGAEKWADDIARQRVLERAGWTFWRCFASSFTRRRQAVMLDLLATLNELGIEPLAEPTSAAALVHRRTADPLGVAQAA